MTRAAELSTKTMNPDAALVLRFIGMLLLSFEGPRSSEDRALASGVRCGSSSLPGGTISFRWAISVAGRGAAVARLVWDQEVGSSSLPAPTKDV